MGLSVDQWLVVGGWASSTALAFLAGLVAHRLTREKKRIVWTLQTAASVLEPRTARRIETPVKILVGDQAVDQLSLVVLRIGNTGNKEVTDATVVVNVEEPAKVVDARISSDTGLLADHIHVSQENNRVSIKFDHLNEGASFDLQVLVSDFSESSLKVDMAEAGVELRRREPSYWDFAGRFILPGTMGYALSLAGIGVRHDPMIPVMTELVDEIRAYRRSSDLREMRQRMIAGPQYGPNSGFIGKQMKRQELQEKRELIEYLAAHLAGAMTGTAVSQGNETECAGSGGEEPPAQE